MTIAERELIARVRRIAAVRNPAVAKSIGDDCAVLRIAARSSPGSRSPIADDVLVTTDFSLEGIHFRRDWHSPESIGHRCLARGLSDIAAMGGKPVAAFLSLALPSKIPQAWVDRFTRGFLALAKKYGVTLAGGDTAESPSGILADIVVVGSVARGAAVLRSGAKPGHSIYATGELGGSAAAYMQMKKGAKLKAGDYERHFFPEPRIEVGKFLREKQIATAMIDTSDGLSTDLSHVCEESGVGAEIYEKLIPRARTGRTLRRVDPALALHGGEDYELLFTARGKKVPARISGVPITEIGRITAGRKIRLISEDGKARELKPQGWEHFRKR
ncbi:MAG TPA: thiamine-phosphate kinase [Candidatus Binatia bacterium]|nr:thiamine-phosphate kinase [Candidatus Binatia bacterium]